MYTGKLRRGLFVVTLRLEIKLKEQRNGQSSEPVSGGLKKSRQKEGKKVKMRPTGTERTMVETSTVNGNEKKHGSGYNLQRKRAKGGKRKRRQKE